MIAGHERIVAQIERDGLPQISLFIGPKSVGKMRLANQLAKAEASTFEDILRINLLTAELARNVATFIHTAPKGNAARVVIVNIQRAPENNLNILLKSLEDVPTFARVILISQDTPMDTILSRAGAVYSFALLTTDQVEEALLLRRFNPSEARIRAEASGGQLAIVLNREETSKLKTLVLVVARCFREHDTAALDALANRWTDEHTDLLVRLAHEATTKRWRIFNEEEIGVIPGRVWLAILRALKPDVRPRLVIHAQLAGVLRSIS